MSKEQAAKGAEVMEKLFGKKPGKLPFPDRFSEYTLEHLFGDVWQGEALALQERSLITCAVLTALAREPEQKVHFTGAKNLGIPREKMEEMITHIAHYAGWPVAVGGFRSLDAVWPVEE
ncbi:MAG: 4-carboxymuconolactone decarboxylase [Gammaproteobacteria bacterium]|jgi:4-carboxymuconolactone decarboxylase